jgi:hypothetical protein
VKVLSTTEATTRARARGWRARARRLGVATALLLSINASQVHAREADPQTRAAARDLAVQGVDAFEAKDYATALDRFNRAAELVSAPSITIMQARSLVKLERWIEALDKYSSVSSTTVPADAPEAFRRAQSDAIKEAAELRSNMPRLEIQSPPAQSQPLVIKLDGRLVPAALLDVEQPVDPGPHTVQAEGDGSVVFRRTVTLAAAQHVNVLITPGTVEASSSASSPEPAPSATFPPSRRVWSYVAFGVGGLGFTVAAISGSIALQKQSRLDAACNPTCPRSSEDDLASFHANRALAISGLVVGTAGVSVGLYLLLSGRGDTNQVAARLTPTGAALSGTF